MSTLSRKSIRGVVVAALLSGIAAVVLPGSAGAAAPPTATVTPTTGLVDAQTVTVSGSGFTPTSNVTVVMCTPNATSALDCDFRGPGLPRSDANGSFTTSFQVIRLVRHGYDRGYPLPPIDCATETCTIGIADGDLDAYQHIVFVPVTFADVAPTLPVVHVTPTSGLYDGQGVTVTGTGFRANERGIVLTQCPPGAIGDADCLASRFGATTGPTGELHTSSVVSRVQREDTHFDCAIVTCTLGVSSIEGFQQIPIDFVRPKLTVSIAPLAPLRAGTDDVVAQATISCDMITPVSLSSVITQPGITFRYVLTQWYGEWCSPTAPLLVFLPSRELVQRSGHYALGPADVTVAAYPLRALYTNDPPEVATGASATVQLVDYDQVLAAVQTALLDPNNTTVRTDLARALTSRLQQDPTFAAEFQALVRGST